MRELLNISDLNLIEMLGCLNSCISYLSILSGKTKGKVWVDSLNRPSFGIVWSEYLEGFQLMGKPLAKEYYKNLRNFFYTELSSFLKEKDIDEFEYAVDSRELLEMMNDIFYDKNIQCEWQHNYKVKEYKPICLKKEELDSIIKIDTEFLNKGYYNTSEVYNEVIAAWGSIENYLENGFGFATINSDEISSRIISIAEYDNNHVLAVDTFSNYRRLGYASLLLRKVLNEAFEKGYKILWDCHEFNEASKKTAAKEGLEFDYKYKVYWFSV